MDKQSDMASATTSDEQVSNAQLAPNERFFRYFQHEVTDLQEQMTRIQHHSITGGERADAIDHCLAAIARLSTEVQDASSYIPAYDQRTYGDAIKALNTKLQDVRSSVAPKRKFAFKSNPLFTATKNESAISINDAAELARSRRGQMSASDVSNASSFATTPIEAATPAEEQPPVVTSTSNGSSTSNPDASRSQPSQSSRPSHASLSISNRSREYFSLPSTTTQPTSSATVTNISRSIIDLSSLPFAGLTLKNISSSLILCGHVAGAIHLTNISTSVIVVATRQFRMHNSSNCDVYLLASSRPIIEDCSGIRFAPMPETYMLDGEREKENLWARVDDFKWLRNEQSPNWRVMEPGGRVEEKVWKEVAAKGREMGLEEILKAVGVGRS